MMINSLEEIIERLNAAKNIAVFCHARPDGDALGAGLALSLALKKAGKNAYMCCEDAPPEKFSFISSVKNVLQELPNIEYDALVCVDCADITRMGVFTNFFKQFKKITINIDHHISNNNFAKLNYVEECPACSEIITELLIKAGYEITEEIATLLMVGIVTDTGNFAHQDVTEKTFRAAAHLRKMGADVNLINYDLFARQPKARALLYGRVMNKIRFALDEKFAFVVIAEKDLNDFGADKSLTEGFVDFPLSIDGVEVSAAILESKKGQYKVSLRSKGKVNVNAVATSFGGGGHVLASGCMLFGELEEVVERLSYAVYQNL